MSRLTGSGVLDLWHAATASLEYEERADALHHAFGALCEIAASEGVPEARLREAFAAAAAFARSLRDTAGVA